MKKYIQQRETQMMICVDEKNMTSIAMLYVAMEHLSTNLNFYDNINLEQKERIINMKIDRFNVVELKDGNRATIIDVRGKKMSILQKQEMPMDKHLQKEI